MLHASLLPILALFPAQTPAQSQFTERPGELEFTGRMIVRPIVDAQATAVSRLEGLVIRDFPETREYVVRVPEGMDENSISRAWMATGDYEYVEPDWLCFPLGDPNDPEYGNQWHHVNMESSQGWDLITGDSNQIISWCDTGVDHAHPDLAANLIPGYNAPDQLEEINGGDTSDINGHGTHVAGCLGAIGNNGVGVAGVTWNMQLMPVRVSNSSSGGAYLSDILDGARWAADNGAKTVSASYSGVDNSSVGTTGTDVKQKGGLFFYAADNNGTNHSGFDYPDTIVVGATDSSDQKPSWSSYGKAIDVAAPGVGILSTVVGGGYQAWSGTSMATPVANGVAAMIFAVNPWFTPDQVQARLYASCDDIGAPGEDNIHGHGRVNLRKAINAGLSGDLVLSVTPLVAGSQATLSLSGASAGQFVWFANSLSGTAVYQISSLMTTAGLNNPNLITRTSANASGNATFSRVLPNSAAGINVWLQAVTIGDSSNLVAEQIQ